jgi:hypothetical protein
MVFRWRCELDNLIEESYYFISLNPDAQNLQKQTFGGTSSGSEGRTVFASDTVSNFPDRRGEGPTGVSPRLVLQF